jgi:hypothetical protein
MIKNLCQDLWNILVVDVGNFCHDMSTLTWTTQIWALLFPFPQFVLGLASAVFIGPTSIGAWFLYCRVVSFIIAGQIQKQCPFSKIMGPIMHVPMYILLPIAIRWIYQCQQQSSSKNDDVVHVNNTMTTKFHFYFVVYTTVISSISLILDGSIVLMWFMGKNVGSFNRSNNHSRTGYWSIVE